MSARGRRSSPVPIRLKLSGALTPPLVALVTVTALEVVGALGQMHAIQGQTALADASIGPLSLLNDLQRERNAAGIYLLGMEDAVTLEVEDNGQARRQTDAAARQLRAQVAHLEPSLRRAYDQAFASLDDLADTRQRIDTYEGARSLANSELSAQVFDSYTAVSEELDAANQQVVAAIDDPTVRQGSELALLSTRQGDLTARIVRDLAMAQVGGPAPDGLNDESEITGVAGLLSQLRHNEDELRAAGSGAYRRYVEQLFAADEVTALPAMVERVIRTGDVDLPAVLAATTGGTGDSPYTVFRKEVAAAIQDHARDQERAAAMKTRWLGGIAVFATGLAAVITLLVARSITRPLAALTHQARDMARRRLPAGVGAILATPLGQDVEMPAIEPVDVRSRDEVVDVAGALTTVQETAIGLAVEQAVLRRNLSDSFLNMGRRNQNLLERQLELITRLESGETDPRALGNLFQLDHLATRMRRNAESLLVLAGVERPRRWTAPINIGAVIKAALGEVEDFRRVDAHSVTPVAVDGAAASDLAHVLAELVENALVHSPHDTLVHVRGAPGGNGYRLAVIDSGIGMTPDDLERANRRLSGTESYTVAPSRYLGHYVAGHLAARHNVTVRLQPSPVQGLTAVVELPPALLVHLVTAWDGQHPDHRRTVPLPRQLPSAASGGGPPGRR